MSVRVVRGTAGETSSEPTPRNQSKNENVVNPTQLSVLSSSTTSLVNSEAVNVAVRTTRGATPSEKIKDSRQAKEVADGVADKIKDAPSALDVHDGLSSTSARAHIVA